MTYRYPELRSNHLLSTLTMKHTKALLFTTLFATTLTAHAGQAKFTESVSASVKCYKDLGDTICGIENKGKYSATAYIAADTFASAGITFDVLNDASTIDIEMGNFLFSSTLGDAASRTLTANKLNAKWLNTHDVCNLDGVCKKPAVDTTVTIAANSRSVMIRVTGNNKSTDSDSFGQSAFIEPCQLAGNNALIQVPTSLTVDGVVFATTISGTCKVKTKTVTKNGESFDLESVSFSGTAGYLE